MHHGEFRDPRLVEVYDAAFGWSRDDEFFVSVVKQFPRSRVLDLGCGTGRLALALSEAGHLVTGVDPAAASLAAARGKPGAASVTWLDGTSADLATRSFDVAVMTSHVAQFFVTDDAWGQALGDLARALVPGGRLVFDSRDPAARQWERWNPTESRRIVTLADGRAVTTWTEVTERRGGVVDVALTYRFPDRLELVSSASLHFREEALLRSTLGQAGFEVEHVYGGWERQPIGHVDGELLVVARVTS
jgi:SAM-dependent methyltransferase